MLQSMWYLFLSIEILACIIVTTSCFILGCMNALFLYAMIDKRREKQDRFFKFDVDFKWLTPDTLYIPFEFRLLLCNYYIVRLSAFGKGFEFKINWFDVDINVPPPPKKVDNVLRNSLKLEGKEKTRQLKKVNTIPMDLLVERGKGDLSNMSTLQTKTLLRKQHSLSQSAK